MKTTGKNVAITISVRDMFLYIISHWRSILIAAVLGCLVLSAYTIFNSKADNTALDMKEMAEDTLNHMSQAERDQAMELSKELLNDLNQYTYYSDYIKKSKFQNLNPNNILRTTLNYYITNDGLDVSGIVKAYESEVTGETLTERLMKEEGVDSETAFYELDNCVITQNKLVMENEHIEQSFDYNSLVVYVYDDDPESLKKRVELVKNVIDSFYTKISANVGRFKISLAAESTGRSNDYYVFLRQNQTFINRNNFKDSINETMGKISGTQRNIICYEISKFYHGDYVGMAFPELEDVIASNGEENSNTDNSLKTEATTSRGGVDSSEVEVQKSSGFSPDKKKMVIGFLGGFLLMAVLWMLYYMFFGILHVKEDISCIFDLPVIGTFTTKKKFRNLKFDKWIWSLRMGRKAKTPEEELSEISGRLEMFAETSGVAKVALILNEETENLKDLLKDLKGSLEIQILDSVTDVVKIQEVQAVVLLAKSDESKILKIQSDLSFFDGTDRKILGLILAE